MNNRWISLDGVENIRDLGGLKNKMGETLAEGQFYRSAALQDIRPQGISEARAAGITTLVDLRSTIEEQALPNTTMETAGFKIVNVPMLDHMQSNINGDLTGFPTTMTQLYYDLLKQYGTEFAQVISTLARTQGGTLFHCAVGKDRTGLVSMFLLSIAGVDQETIIKDYALSQPLNGQGPEEHPSVPSFVFFAEPEWMKDVFTWIEKEYSSPVKYLLQAGVSREDLEQIRKKFNVSLNLEG